MSGKNDSAAEATSPISPMSVRANSENDMGTGPSDPLYTRFKTWRSIVGNLLEYFEQLESFHKMKSKEYTKLSKTPEVPFKQPEFAQDGIALIWQGIRDKNVQLANFHAEEAQLLKAGTIADLGRVRADLKKHLSDLEKEGIKGSKKVEKRLDKFSDVSQSLGKWIPVAETNPTSLDSNHDPYVLWRQTKYKLYRAVDEENVLNEQLLALQNRCQAGEKLIVTAIKKAIQDATDNVSKETQYHLTVANELNAIAINIPPEREWENFQSREPSLLEQDHKPRDPSNVTFPFDNHSLVQPVLEATLARKSTLLKRRQTSSYVLTRSGFLLEYKDNDPVSNPEPSLALKLADCEIGPPPAKSGKAGFTVRGKDSGKMVGRTHEYVFRTDNTGVAEQWWTAIEKMCGAGGSRPFEESPGSESPNEALSPTTTEGTSATSPTSPTSTMTSPTSTTSPYTPGTATAGGPPARGQAVPGGTATAGRPADKQVSFVPATAAPTTTAGTTSTPGPTAATQPNPSLTAANTATRNARPTA